MNNFNVLGNIFDKRMDLEVADSAGERIIPIKILDTLHGKSFIQVDIFTKIVWSLSSFYCSPSWNWRSASFSYKYWLQSDLERDANPVGKKW